MTNLDKRLVSLRNLLPKFLINCSLKTKCEKTNICSYGKRILKRESRPFKRRKNENRKWRTCYCIKRNFFKKRNKRRLNI